MEFAELQILRLPDRIKSIFREQQRCFEQQQQQLKKCPWKGLWIPPSNGRPREVWIRLVRLVGFGLFCLAF